MESLVNLLHYVAKVIALGWLFLHNMITLLKNICYRNHHIRLNKEFRANLQYWLTFMETWNGVFILHLSQSSTQVASDALGSWSCGALCDNQWFQLQWLTSYLDKHKELIPVVLATMVSSMAQPYIFSPPTRQ